MPTVRTVVLAFLAGGLAVTTVSAGALASTDKTTRQASGPGGGERASPSSGSATVTLITGDRVLMTKGPNGYTAVPAAGPGREGVAFGTERRGDSTWVIPSDAVSLIASGRLDKRLFEVTALATNGYGDDKRTTIPLIVQHSDEKPVSGRLAGATAGRELRSAGATVVQENKQSATKFWTWLTGTTRTVPGQRSTLRGAYASGVRRVWLDGRVKASLDRSVPQVGAPTAWQKKYTGKGVKVAVLDTGIDATHLDLKGAVVAAKDFSGTGSLDDVHGHGTHVASIIAGDGARSGGKYKGVAPDASLLNGKVLDGWGAGSESGVIAGMEWAVAQEAQIVNLSMGGWPYDGTGPMDLALNRLTLSSGTLFVVAAGNGGPSRYTVESPASADQALSVAATNRNQTTASFSSAGPRRGDFTVKPEIAAPGKDIVAATANDTWPNGYYRDLSGTSMASAHVAGAAAVLAQQQPTWDARLLKPALTGTAKLPLNESVFRQGAGFLDVSRAVTQKVFALESSVSANQPWPSAGPVTRTVTYRNPGSTPLTLDLSFTPKDQNGKAAATGVFSLPGSVTVPARTTAKVTLTIDAGKSRPGLLYQGRINATADGIVVRTPVSVNVQPEAYDVVLDITDRNGDKVNDLDHGQLLGAPYLIDLSKQFGGDIYLQVKDGRLTARVPRGAYTISVQVLTPSSKARPSVTLLSVPRFTATAPVTLNLDARAGKRATAAVEAAGARTFHLSMGLMQRVNGVLSGTGAQITDRTAEPRAYVVGTPAVSRPFQFTLFQGLSTPDRTYELAFGNVGELPANPTYPVADSDLADLSITLGAHNVKMVGDYDRGGSFGSDQLEVGFGTRDRITLPSMRRHLVSVTALGKPLYRYSTLFAFTTAGEYAYNESGDETSYQAGKRYELKLSTAAFTPQGGAYVNSDGFLTAEFGPYNSSGGGGLSSTGYHGDIVLKRDGTVVGESEHPFVVHDFQASGTATYTAVMRATRQAAWSGYVPKVSGTWTFKATVPSSGYTELPFISTVVSGNFDGWGRAPAGRAFPLTLDIDGAADGVATATVRVSYDDGKTWTTVPVSDATGQWVATVTHPNVTSAYVSLRVIVTDEQGNSGGFTATRSYKIAQLG